jgi:hypothetical protein
MKTHLRLFLGYVVLLAGWVGSAFGMTYAPYGGIEGYQELALGADLYFVAFHGARSTPATDVILGWRTRAAQLCVAAGTAQFVELEYSFEPVLTNDPLSFDTNRRSEDATLLPAAFIYIPIFTPRRTGGAFIDAPTRQAHVRCIRDLSLLIQPDRAIYVAPVLDEARARGWLAGS